MYGRGELRSKGEEGILRGKVLGFKGLIDNVEVL